MLFFLLLNDIGLSKYINKLSKKDKNRLTIKLLHDINLMYKDKYFKENDKENGVNFNGY